MSRDADNLTDPASSTERPTDLIRLVHRLGDELLAVDIDERFAAGQPNPEALSAMARAGLFGLTLPPRYGGLGRDYHALAAACEELARIDLAYQISVTVHLALTAMTMLQWGTRAQRDEWLPALARAERIATFALTEPGAGSDVAAIRSRGVRDGSGYRLNGEKTWISCAEDATLFLAFATLDPAARHRGITAFLIPRETPGVSTTSLQGKLGVRAGETGSVVLDDVWVPANQMIGDPGEGFPIALSALATGLFTVGCGALGVAVECLARTLDFLKRLATSGFDVRRHQWVQARVAAMVADEARSRLLLSQAAERKNRGLPSQQATSLAKWTAARAAHDAAASALEIHQAFRPGPHLAIERHLANAKGAVIYGGTEEIHQTMQAAYALGERTERPFRCSAPTVEDLKGGQ